ncbi:MAG: hypothetical protein H7222_05275 [Methylotenera sp.]|nr:hypothetical protein [Oligoflexia bacterium]
MNESFLGMHSRKAQHSCMNSGGFECNQALQCYVVRRSPSMMCDYIIPPTPAQLY